MAYKRALWQSGLTYQATCDACRTVVRYTDRSLDFRPWFADGFVYCPTCKHPIRHSEHFAIDADGNFINPPPPKAQPVAAQQPAVVSAPTMSVAQKPVPEAGVVFCKKCGKQLSADDNFCSGCGTKIE